MEKDQWAHEEEISFLSALPPLSAISFAICCSETLEVRSCFIYDSSWTAWSIWQCSLLGNVKSFKSEILIFVNSCQAQTPDLKVALLLRGSWWNMMSGSTLLWHSAGYECDNSSTAEQCMWWNMKYRPCGEVAYKQKARQKGANVKDAQRLIQPINQPW